MALKGQDWTGPGASAGCYCVRLFLALRVCAGGCAGRFVQVVCRVCDCRFLRGFGCSSQRLNVLRGIWECFVTFT